MNDSSEETKLLKRKLEDEYEELDIKKQKIEQQYEELYEHVFRVSILYFSCYAVLRKYGFFHPIVMRIKF